MKLLTAAAMALALVTGSVNAAEQLNAYSIMPEKYASKVFSEFTKDTGIKVNFMRFSSGEALARLNAEKKNPQVDVMLGGPADTYAAGVKEDIFEQYRPKDSDAIPASLRDPQNHWTGIGIIPLCFLTNTKFLEKNNMKAPETWNDLLDPHYKNNLQMADARTSGTATERIYSLVKVMGEDPAFAYQKKLNGNIQMYTKSGAGGAMPIATGQCASGIFYIVDALDIKQQGYPVVIGEMGVQDKTHLSAGMNEFRRYWLEYIVKSAKNNGCIPVYWDNGWNGKNGFGLFDRLSKKVTQPELIEAMTRAINSDGDYEIAPPQISTDSAE